MSKKKDSLHVKYCKEVVGSRMQEGYGWLSSAWFC